LNVNVLARYSNGSKSKVRVDTKKKEKKKFFFPFPSGMDQQSSGAGTPQPEPQLSEAEKAANTKLKERSLRFWLSLTGQPVSLHLWEELHSPTPPDNNSPLLHTNRIILVFSLFRSLSTTVEGTLCAIDSTQELVQVSGLITPVYQYPEAIVRTSDIRYLVSLPAVRNSS